MSSNPASPPTATATTTPKPTFTSLPPELRHAIWHQSFTPRTLTITPTNLYTHRPTTSPLLGPSTYIIFRVSHDLQPLPLLKSIYFGQDPQAWSPAPPGPVQLYICRESRAIALTRYELAFAGKKFARGDGDKGGGGDMSTIWTEKRMGEKRIWVDFARDTIHFPTSKHLNTLTLIAADETRKIRNLVLSAYWKRDVFFHDGAFRSMKGLLGIVLGSFEGLETLVVNCGEGVDGERVRRQLGAVLEGVREKSGNEGWRPRVDVHVGFLP